MGEKNIQLYSPAGMLYCDGAPLLVCSAALFAGKRSKKKFVRLRLKNISGKTIQAAMVTVRALSDAGKGEWGDVVCPLDGLDAARDGEFGQDRSFALLDGDVRSFSVSIGEVVFADGSTWSGDGAWTELIPQKTLAEGLGSEELAAQFRIRYGADCTYMPDDRRGLWFCACGGINRQDEQKCHLCRRTYAAQRSVNLSSLKAECAERLQTEQRWQEEDSGESAQRKKKQLRFTVVVAPIALVLMLIAAILPGYIAEKKAYNTAAALLSAGMYEDAAAAFGELGAYGDSREQAEKNVPYQKALYILDCADNASIPGLTLLDMKRSQFEDDEHMCIALYQGAAEQFKALGDYRDSAAKLAYAESAAEELSEQLNFSDYSAAAELLRNGYYCQARDAFEALGDYKDSKVMATECLYQKALALLGFVEKYSVRGVDAKLSTVTGTPDSFHFTMDAMGRLGEACTGVLRELCAGDGIDLQVDDTAVDGMQPLCQCVNELFAALGKYRDSAALAQRATQAGDFTKPFYDFCSQGKLAAAINWLTAYDGDFDGREQWLETLQPYLPFCQSWQLHMGDSTLIPLTVGADGTCGEFTTVVAVDASGATLRISFGDAGKTVELNAEPGSTKFTATMDGYSYYFAGLNNQGHFTYIKYDAAGKMVSSCEYDIK